MRSACFSILVLAGVVAAISQRGGGVHDLDFSAGSHFRKEVKESDGMTRGEYGFRTPDGCLHVVSYEAHPVTGYRVLGSKKRECGHIITTRRPTTNQGPTTTSAPITFTTLGQQVSITPPAKLPFMTTTSPSPSINTGRPRNNFPAVRPIDDNTITTAVKKVEEDPQGRQLQPGPTTTTPSPPTFIEVDAEDPKPKPIYTFGYTTPTHGHTESGLPNGSKKGEYYWDGPDGWRRIVTYEANERGFFPKLRQVRIPTTTTTTTTTPSPTTPPSAAPVVGKDLLGDLPPPAGGCPYYFYYNTRINYHWERCFENHTKVGEFGHLGSDGYVHKTEYLADTTGFHPRLTRTPLTPRQENVVAQYTEGAFIVPKPDEERRDTEKRILAWLADNRNRIEEPLR